MLHPIVFIDDQDAAQAALQGSYSSGLVVLSLVIAILGAFSGFSHVDLMRATESARTRTLWHLSGAFVLGLSVWTMHFTGMVAFDLPVEITYQVIPTLLSIIPAVIAGYVILSILVRPAPPTVAILIGGLIMGGGIGLMHYLGMSAMVTVAIMAYQPGLFVLSLAVAIVVATLALAVPGLLGHQMRSASRRQPVAFKIIGAALLGVAIATMHYVAMGATRFLPPEVLPGHSPHTPADSWVATPEIIAGLAVGGSLLLLLTTTLSAILRTRITLSNLEIARLEARQHLMNDRFNKIARRLPGMVYQFRLSPDGEMSFPFASQAIEDIYGVTHEQVRHNVALLETIILPEDIDSVYSTIADSAENLTVWQHEYRVRRWDGSVRWLQGNAMPEREPEGGVIWSGFITDITERRHSEDIIHRLAFYDELTGLPNRRLLQDRLELAIQASRRHQLHGALLFLDLDDFKSLNDTKGHSQGDALLMRIAEKLNHRLRTVDTVARLGGDEFVIILDDLNTNEDIAATEALATAEDILRLLNQPISLDHYQYQTSVSIGICLFFGDELSKDELLRRSDIAMYQSKSAGRNTIRFFDPDIQSAMEDRFRLESELRQAISEHQLKLHYQCQVNQEQVIVGAEALLRWQHPNHGMVSPGTFIPLAEESGLILPIGQWVIESAAEQLQRWQDHPDTCELTLSVNVSARQFHQEDFVQLVKRAIERYQITASLLILELTETLILADLDDTREKMDQLRAMGVGLALDDFGTGYSSMAYLSQLRFDEVKIDQSFVRNLLQSEARRDWVIVEAIINITRGLEMQVTAEGVETEAQRDFLTARQCSQYQGYLFGRPVPIAEFNAQLATSLRSVDR